MSLPIEIAALFVERFPRYALLLSLWEQLPPPLPPVRLDKAWLHKAPLRSAEVLYVYGIGDGSPALLLEEWLSQDKARRLVFLEPMASRIIDTLRQNVAVGILQHPQIDLFHVPPGSSVSLVQLLAERYPVRDAYAILGASTDRKKLARFQMQLLQKTALTHAHFLERLYSHLPLRNLLRNLRRLPSAFYANRLKGAFQGVPAIICGAGPSLSASMELLKTVEDQALLIAGGSAIAALSAQGIAPHIAVAIDPNFEELKRLQNSFAFETPLLFSTRLFPDCFSCCNGPYGYLRSGMSSIAELWFEEALGLNDPILGASLPDESLSVTTLCAAIANHFGCNPILFDGVDLAYTDRQRYAIGVADETLIPSEHLQPIDRVIEKRDRHGKKVKSAVRWVMESKALSQFAKSTDKRWINCTQGGLGLQGIEEMNLKEALQLCAAQRDLKTWVHSAVFSAAMPKAAEAIIDQKMEELHKSLKSVVAHLEILARGEENGQSLLAEMDLKGELAYDILFYDIESTLRVVLKMERFETKENKQRFWQAFHQLALSCERSFLDF